MWQPLAEASILLLLGALAFPSVSDTIVFLRYVTARRRERTGPAPLVTPRLLVLVPAHNEERLVGRAIGSLLAAHYPPDRRRILVIADNCDDHTEEVARDAGAECIVRDEPDKPGKPQALAWATARALKWNGFDWDAIVVVDADSIVHPDFLQAIGAVPNLRRVICQARNGVENVNETWLTVLGDLLVRARYDVLFPAKSRLGLNCPTAGNGTGIGRELLQSGWQAFSLAEGWELYARTTIEGRRSIYVEQARIASQEARTVSQSASQRRRWTAGRWHVLKQLGWKIAAARNVSIYQRLDTLCELSNPGPVSHLGTLLPVLLLAGMTMESATLAVGIGLAVIGVAPYLVAYGIAVLLHPHPWIVIKALARVPAYAAWRLPATFLAMLAPRNELWQRTERHEN